MIESDQRSGLISEREGLLFDLAQQGDELLQGLKMGIELLPAVEVRASRYPQLVEVPANRGWRRVSMNPRESSVPLSDAHVVDRLELVHRRLGKHEGSDVEVGGYLQCAGHHAAGQADQTEIVLAAAMPIIAGGGVFAAIE